VPFPRPCQVLCRTFLIKNWNVYKLEFKLNHYKRIKNNIDIQRIVFLKCIHITFTKRILRITILVTHKFKIQDRRRKVATMLAQSMTETEIDYELKVDQSIISRDIKVLKGLS
jgi:hypothetical protein